MTSSVAPETDLSPAATRALRYATDVRELVGGNRVALLRNGRETFPAWLAAIDAARERVSLEMYIFQDDSIGRRFAEALMAAAARGVTVRLLYDFVGCRDTPASFFQQLRAGGVHTIAYHKYRFWRPRFWGLIRRNHRKTLVCDGTVAFTGGVNIADAWVAPEDGGGGWHDATVRVEGPGGGARGGGVAREGLPAHLEPPRPQARAARAREVGASGARGRHAPRGDLEQGAAR